MQFSKYKFIFQNNTIKRTKGYVNHIFAQICIDGINNINYPMILKFFNHGIKIYFVLFLFYDSLAGRKPKLQKC